MWSGCLPDDSLRRCFRHVSPAGSLRADPELTGEIISLGRLKDTLVISGGAGNKSWREEGQGVSALVC